MSSIFVCDNPINVKYGVINKLKRMEKGGSPHEQTTSGEVRLFNNG
ncbi:hypothetical protein DES38_104252 [Streptohalobacillus salinus]|uniref:Uncharacterized protein n=1 Tax=Streptohalobacillus salinus TaxID=621096 RepID=A0A2V3WBH7_9BACI|nr:hypothetical protein DES38_104252 [Streptohalobacillus salinus]